MDRRIALYERSSDPSSQVAEFVYAFHCACRDIGEILFRSQELCVELFLFVCSSSGFSAAHAMLAL